MGLLDEFKKYFALKGEVLGVQEIVQLVGEATGVAPAKVPSFNLGAPSTLKTYYGGPGTYTLNGVQGVYSDALNVFFWDGDAWDVLEVPIVVPEPDLTDYAKKEEVRVKLNTGSFEDVARKVVTSKNLFDKNISIRGKLFNQTLKKLTDSAISEVTGFIPVEPGTYIRSHTGQIGGYATDDPDTEAIVIYTSGSKTFTVTAESGVKFVLQTLTTQSNWTIRDIYQLERGTVETPYVPFAVKWSVKESELPPSVKPSDIINDVITGGVSKVLAAEQGVELNDRISAIAELRTGKNRFDKSKLRVGFTMAGSPPDIRPASNNVKMSGYIPVEEGKTYTRISTGTLAGFANEGDVVSIMALPNQRTFTIPVGSGIRYVVAILTSQGTVGIEDVFQLEEGTESTSYEPYTLVAKIKKSALPDNGGGSGSGVDAESLAAEREIINQNIDSIAALKEETEATINSLLKLEGVDSGEMTINIPGLDHDVENYILRVGLHFRSERGTPSFDEIFFNEQCRTDFSDLRFFEGETGNLLDFNIHAKGNYDIVRDSRLGVANMGLSTGEIIASDYRSGLRRSNNNGQSWTIINNAMHLVFVDSRDYIFACNPAEFKIYRYAPADNYTTPTMVLDLSSSGSVVQSMLPVDEDSNGVIYMGKYQGVWDTEIFKSIDGGLTFTSVYKSINNQHVHNIKIDRANNTVYAGIDGSGGGGNTAPRCIKTTDGGAAWSALPIPTENRDYGVIYSEPSFRLCSGETPVLGGPTIYKTVDDVNFYPVLNTLQGIRRIVKFGDMLIAGGNAARNNRVGQLYASYDDGETWETIYAENWIGTESVGAGLRNFSNIFTPTGETEPQILLHGEVDWNPLYDYKPLRIFMGGDNHYALAYINVGSLPLTGKTIKVKWGYPVKYPKRQIHSDYSNNSNLIFRLKTDEGRGNFLKESVEGRFINAAGAIQWVNKPTARFGSVYPFARPIRSDGIFITKGIEVAQHKVLPNRNFTVCFWANVNGMLKYDGLDRLIIGDPNGVHLFVNGYRIYLSDGNGNTARHQSFFTPSKGADLWMFYAITVGNETTPLTGAVKDDQYSPFAEPLTAWAPVDSPGKTFIGGDGVGQPVSFPIADIRVFDKALSQEELRNIYFGSEYLAING